jgi:signal transduction histidine kinase
VREQTGIIRGQIQREAAFEERARLAREFHDSLEQQLTGIRLQLDAVKTKFRQDPEEAESYLDTARSLIRHSHDEARRSVWDLRAALLEKGDLTFALGQTIAQLGGTSGARPTLSISGVPRPLDPRIENHLLRLAQEAAGNAVQHAGASQIKVTVTYQTNDLRLEIRDDGSGFDPAAATSESGHFGLLGMRERAEKIGAHFELVSAAEKGTTLTIVVPTVTSSSVES